MKKTYISANHFIMDPEVECCNTDGKQPIEGAIDPSLVLTVLGPVISDFLRSQDAKDKLKAKDEDGFFTDLVNYMKGHKADIFDSALELALGYIESK